MNFTIPTFTENREFKIEPGNSIIFVGANGCGKTRLATYIEENLGDKVLRISAHRALNLNPSVAKISEKEAIIKLKYGQFIENKGVNYLQVRKNQRWGHHAATHLLNDFDSLIQVLFSDQSNVSVSDHKSLVSGETISPDTVKLCKFDRLEKIWRQLMPHRILHISGDDIEVSLPDSDSNYSASEMSDGERAVFYLIGQALVADADSLLIVDEPELHIHRSIMSKLWDALEAERSDCAFLFITHDLEFAASRAAQKYVIKDFKPENKWDIREVPDETGFDEETTTLILGSRKPILFVEGTKTSLDIAIYRCCYPEWTVIPRSSCSEVIRAVTAFRENERVLGYITCSGIVDADAHSESEKEYFREHGINVLPVSEIENLVLLPNVSLEIAKSEGFVGEEADERKNKLKEAILRFASDPKLLEASAIRYACRRIDGALKKVDMSHSRNANDLNRAFTEEVSNIDVTSFVTSYKEDMHNYISTNDIRGILSKFDNKGMISEAASVLKKCKRDAFAAWLTRILRNKQFPKIVDEIRAELPDIQAQ